MASHSDEDYETWQMISFVIGWMYFTMWTLMFFPQATENYSRKSVAGFSIDFAILNPQGYYFYTLYSMGGFI